ncbi:hypothetical protein HK097_000746 [Rhizophlyctis rosea]|uniref:Uncharacterized protein n=1 Tax=Rhizophlyctis rosea TaxID=64517 RepID=A0AAD5X6Z9_9FUNG|nr:hypothetical protein HK097_000746 [Rhizophlyctis rosea]
MRPTSDFGIARADQHLVRLLPHGVLSQTRHGAHPTFAQYARKTFPSDYLHGLPPNDPLYQVLVPSARSCYTGMISSSEITFFRSDTLKTCITIDHQYSGYMLGGSGPSFLFGFTFALMLDQSNFKVWFLMDSFGDDHRHNPEELLHCQDAILPHSTLTCNDGYVAYLSIEGLDSETPYTVVALLSIFGDRHTYECDQIPETRQLLTRSHLLICIPHSDWKIQVVSLTTYDCIRTITIAALTDPIPPERPVKLGSYWVGEHMGGVLGRLLAISDIRLSDCGGRLMISKRQIDVINRINCTQKLLNGLSEIPLMEQAAVLESSSLTVVDVMSEKGIRYNHVMGANLKDSSDVLWYGGNVKNRGNWFWYTPTGKFEDLKCSWVKL